MLSKKSSWNDKLKTASWKTIVEQSKNRKSKAKSQTQLEKLMRGGGAADNSPKKVADRTIERLLEKTQKFRSEKKLG